MTAFAPAAGQVRAEDPTAFATEAFARFRSAAATGDWSGYLELADPAYSFRYPVPGPFVGWNHGGERLLAYIEHVSVEQRIRVDIGNPDRISTSQANGVGVTTVVFESEVAGVAEGERIVTCMAVSMDVADGLVLGHREFIGDMRPFLPATEVSGASS